MKIDITRGITTVALLGLFQTQACTTESSPDGTDQNEGGSSGDGDGGKSSTKDKDNSSGEGDGGTYDKVSGVIGVGDSNNGEASYRYWYNNTIVTGEQTLVFGKVSNGSLFGDYSITLKFYEADYSDAPDVSWEASRTWLMVPTPTRNVDYLNGSLLAEFDRSSGAVYLSFRSQMPLTNPTREVPQLNELPGDNPFVGDYYTYLVKLSEGQVEWIVDDYFYDDGSAVGDLAGVDRKGFVYTSAVESTRPELSYNIVRVKPSGKVDWSIRVQPLAAVTATTSRAGSTYLWSGGSARSQPFITKIDGDGETVWSTTVDQSSCEGPAHAAKALVPAPDDSAVFLLGQCVSKVNSDGQVIWTASENLVPTGMALSEDGGSLYVLGWPLDRSAFEQSLLRMDPLNGMILDEIQVGTVRDLRSAFSRDAVILTSSTEGVLRISSSLVKEQILY